MGTSLKDSFVRYDFALSEIGNKGLPDFSTYETMKLLGAFMLLMINPSYGSDITMSSFANDFSDSSKDYIDRFCRLTDGAGIEKYTLKEFLEIGNQQGLQTLYQPKVPNDVGIVPLWYEYLLRKGVDILTDTEVRSIESDGSRIVSVNNMYFADRFILAIPPVAIANLLQMQKAPVSMAFGPNFKAFAEATAYINYIPITFHWSKKLALPKVYGFPSTDWALAFVVMSDYMPEVDLASNGTVISTAITRTDAISSVTGKSGAMSSQDELFAEALRQLRLSFPDLPDPDKILLSPTVQQINGRWTLTDVAYIPGQQTVKFKSPVFDNLYNLGPHNGHELYNFNSLESAVSNAFVLGNLLEPNSALTRKYQVSGFTTVRQILVISILVLILMIVLCVYIYRKFKKMMKRRW
jgi:hypothetical protein